MEVKFLLDENVKKELLKFLKEEGFDVVLKPKGSLDSMLAEYSKSEQRVLITNDKHFQDSLRFPKEKIFSVVWLRIPQDKTGTLISSFSKLLVEVPFENFEGNLITLYEYGFEIFSIPSA